MSLFEQVRQDWIAARKGGDPVAKNLLTVFYSELSNLTKSPNHASTVADLEVVALAKKYAGNAQQTISILAANLADSDKITALQQEISIVSAYVPKQFSEKELTEIIEQIIKENGIPGPKALGPIMATLKVRYSGQYDSQMASAIAKTILNS